MQNNIATYSIADLLQTGEKCATAALAIGQALRLAQNTPAKINDDYILADGCFRALNGEVANRVPLADTLGQAITTTRTWCFRVKETLAPHLGTAHNALYRPTGFVSSLRVPEDYPALLALTGTLEEYFKAHPDQTNAAPKVKATAARAKEIHDGLKTANEAVENQDALIADKLKEQNAALEGLRDRLRWTLGELSQLIPEDDRRWRRFGFNIPAEPETPAQPENVQVDNALPGRLVLKCPPVPFAERFRAYAGKVGTTDEPVLLGSSPVPLFDLGDLEPGVQYNLFLSAVNSSGNEGPKSKVVVAAVLARAAS